MPTELSPLTGRDHEMSLLKDRWEQAQEGMGQIVLLVGEPGLGKSRLVDTLKDHVLGQLVEGETDSPVIEWRCSPHFQNTGLYPAIDFFERALEFGPEDSPSDRALRPAGPMPGTIWLARPETVPLWASLLSLPTTDRFPAAFAVSRLGSEKKPSGADRMAANSCRAAADSVHRRRLALGRRLDRWNSWGN